MKLFMLVATVMINADNLDEALKSVRDVLDVSGVEDQDYVIRNVNVSEVKR